MMPTSRLADQIALHNDSREIARLDAWYRCLAEDWPLPAMLVAEMRVCLHEAVTNIVMHGNGCRRIWVAATLEDGEFALSVEDDGPPFDPLKISSGPLAAPLLDVAIGGLGMHLIRSFTDRLAYVRRQERNLLTMARTVDV